MGYVDAGAGFGRFRQWGRVHTMFIVQMWAIVQAWVRVQSLDWVHPAVEVRHGL